MVTAEKPFTLTDLALKLEKSVKTYGSLEKGETCLDSNKNKFRIDAYMMDNPYYWQIDWFDILYAEFGTIKSKSFKFMNVHFALDEKTSKIAVFEKVFMVGR